MTMMIMMGIIFLLWEHDIVALYVHAIKNTLNTLEYA